MTPGVSPRLQPHPRQGGVDGLSKVQREQPGRDAAIGALTKIAGLPRKYHSRFNAEDFIAQARDFKGLDGNLFDRFTKLLSIIGQDHPWTVMRAAEFERWASGGEYNRIVSARAAQGEDDLPARFCPRCGCRLPIGDERFCPCCGHSIKLLTM
jgi:hypothetical protein